MIKNPSTTRMELITDQIHIQDEHALFRSEFDRFMQDHVNEFNSVMFEDAQILPVPDYFNIKFTYLDGAMVAEINFSG